MDKISNNTDDLLVKILSLLPTKVAVSISILSKRWKFLWMWLPDLECYDDEIKPYNILSLRRFIKRSLNQLSVLDRLRLGLMSTSSPFEPEDITLFVGAAVTRGVRYLRIDYDPHHTGNKTATLPICLYKCKSLLELSLEGAFLMDVPRFACLPSLVELVLLRVRYLDESFRLLDASHRKEVCFPCLKYLCLTQVDFFDEESLPLLLANCPDLRELHLERNGNDNNVGAVSINVPSLETLSILHIHNCSSNGVEIVAPSLTSIVLADSCNSHFLIKNMPKLEDAYIEATNIFDTAKFLAPFSSTKRLTLCLFIHRSSLLAGNVDAISFNQLESLYLCACRPYWSVLLVRLLKGSPKLKFLKLYLVHEDSTSFAPSLIRWNNILNLVPDCLPKTSLETFNWTDLPRTQESRDMVSLVSYMKKISPPLKSETTSGKWSAV